MCKPTLRGKKELRIIVGFTFSIRQPLVRRHKKANTKLITYSKLLTNKMEHITARELRLGNLVFGQYRVIEKVDLKILAYVVSFEAGEVAGTKMPSPITLSEEWFLRFGFRHSSFMTAYDQRGHSGEIFSIMDLADFDKPGYFALEWNQVYAGKPFRYVHELQNIYFTVTGKELEIKELV